MSRWLLLPLLFLLSGCASAPTRSPQATIAFHATQAIKVLDLARDFTTDANAQIPPLVSTPTTRKIVTFHRSAITTIHDLPNGWKPTVSTALDEVQRDLPAADAQKLAPYFGLIKAVIQEVP